MKRCALVCAGLLVVLLPAGCRKEPPQEAPRTFDESTYAPASALRVSEDENLLTPPGRLPVLPGAPAEAPESGGDETGKTDTDSEEGASGETE